MIVEGYGRKRYKADFIKYLVYAHAECDETILHLDFLLQTGSAKDEARVDRLKTDYINLSRGIFNFIRWVEDNFDPEYRAHEPELPGWSLANREVVTTA